MKLLHQLIRWLLSFVDGLAPDGAHRKRQSIICIITYTVAPTFYTNAW
jgi:hypothetical protein